MRMQPALLNCVRDRMLLPGVWQTEDDAVVACIKSVVYRLPAARSSAASVESRIRVRIRMNRARLLRRPLGYSSKRSPD